MTVKEGSAQDLKHLCVEVFEVGPHSTVGPFVLIVMLLELFVLCSIGSETETRAQRCVAGSVVPSRPGCKCCSCQQ